MSLAVRLLVFFLLIWFALPSAAVVKQADEQKRREAKPCTDFLAEIGRSHPRLEYVKCESSNDAQLRVLRSTYRVAGVNAAEIEKHLIKTSRMGSLGFACCGWEVVPKGKQPSPRYGEYRKGSDRFRVSMTSNETVVNKRSRWSEIPFFEVDVTFYVDEP
jgi:hypothetical protein